MLTFTCSVKTFSQEELEGFGAEAIEKFVPPKIVPKTSIKDFRIWTSKSGSKVGAKFLRVDDQKIVVALKEGKEFAIPIYNLSQQDRILLDKFMLETRNASDLNFQSLRFWTSSDGKVVEAKIVGASDIGVEIERSDGKRFRLPLERISSTDRMYVSKFKSQDKILSTDQILKRIAMYKWKNTTSDNWSYRYEFELEKISDNRRKAKKIWKTGKYQNGYWSLGKDGLIHSGFGVWRFPLNEDSRKILRGINQKYPTLYGSTGFD